MKRLFVVTALIVTLIARVRPSFGEELRIMEMASDWMKAAKLPSSEVAESLHLLTKKEQVVLLQAITYTTGFKQGIDMGGTLSIRWGADEANIKQFISDCTFVKERTGDTYDRVRDYLIGELPTNIAFMAVFMITCVVE